MNEIYDTLGQSIQAGGYRLEDILRRINVLYAAGQLSEEERSGLIDEANAHADPEAERPELQEQITALAGQLSGLAARVDALEAALTEDGGGDGAEDYPAWVRPVAGISTDYQPGAIVRHNGKLWQNVYQLGQNVWEPGVVDGTFWAEYTPETGE